MRAEIALGKSLPSARSSGSVGEFMVGVPTKRLSDETLSDLKFTAERRWAEQLTLKQLKARQATVGQAFGLHEHGYVTGAQIYRQGLEAAVDLISAVTRGLVGHGYRFEDSHRDELIKS